MEELTRFFSSVEFSSPLYFWAGGAVIIFLIFLPLLETKKNLRWDRGYWIKRVPKLKAGKPWPLFALIAVISLLIAAVFAGPRIVEKRSIPLYGKPVMILFDVSGSIGLSSYNANYGVAGSFSAFESAKGIYYDIVKRDTGATIGLSFYSDQSYVARDFAEKVEYLKDTIENDRELAEISGGTETAEALFMTRTYFSEKARTENKAIVLISDFIDNLDWVAYEMKQVLKDDIRVYAVVVAESSDSAYRSIQTLKSKVASDRLVMVWSGEAEGISKICEEISGMESSVTGEVEILSQRSLVPFILPVILGLIILSVVLSETTFRKIP